MSELSVQEKLDREFQEKIASIELDHINFSFFTEELCNTLVGKEVQIRGTTCRVNSVSDRNIIEEDGFKRHTGAFKFYFQDDQGKEIQYYLNPETMNLGDLSPDEKANYQEASVDLIKAIYAENKNLAYAKFDDEDADYYLENKVKSIKNEISEKLNQVKDSEKEIEFYREMKALESGLSDAKSKIEVFVTPRTIALHHLAEPIEKMEMLSQKIESYLIIQNPNLMENQEKKEFDLKEYLQKQDNFFKNYEIRNPEGKFYDNDIVKIALIYKAHKQDLNDLIGELEKTSSISADQVRLTDKEKDNPVLIGRDKRALLTNYFNDCSQVVTELKAHIIADQTKPVPKREFIKDDAIFDRLGNINIVEFLDRTGKFEVSRSNTQNWRNQLDNKAARGIKIKEVDTNNIYMVYNGVDKKFFIQTPPPDKSFSGNLLKFVAEKLLGHPTVKDKDAKREALNYIKNFYSEAELSSPTSVQAQYKNLESSRLLKENYQNREMELKDLKYPIYLVSRGIKPSTLGHPTFKPLIKHAVDINKKEKQNIAFIFKDKEGKMTYQELNLGNKGYYKEGTSTSGMLFVSNAKAKKVELIFAESVIDLLSYAQMNGIRKDAEYVASGGFLNKGQVNHISSLLDDKKYELITLCVDNDLQGEIYKKQIIEAVLQKEIEKINMVLDLESPDLKQIDLLAKLEDLAQQTEGLNNLVFNKDLSKEERQEPLTKMNQLVIQELSSMGLQNIEIQNPKGKDFNEDLMKESGMSREHCQASTINDDFDAKKLFDMEKSGLDTRLITDKYIESEATKTKDLDQEIKR